MFPRNERNRSIIFSFNSNLKNNIKSQGLTRIIVNNYLSKVFKSGISNVNISILSSLLLVTNFPNLFLFLLFIYLKLMEIPILSMAIIFLIYQSYCFLQEGGLNNSTAQRLFWMLICIICLVISYIVYNELNYWNDEEANNSTETSQANNNGNRVSNRSRRRSRSRSPIILKRKPLEEKLMKN